MHLLKLIIPFIITAALVSCAKGGPVTPVESYEAIKTAVDANDSAVILNNLSAKSIEKIDSLDKMLKQMRDDQIASLAKLYNCEPARLKNMKRTDYVSLYFFVKHGGIDFAALFREKVIAVDVDGDRALIRTEGGIELGFVREGPYWKLDISDL